MIECDVRRSGDGVLLTQHDPEFRGKSIQNWTCQELQEHKPIPSLEAVLQLVQNRCRLDLELKESGYEDTVLELTKRYLNPDRFIVTSFSDASLQSVRQQDPTILTGLLIPAAIGPEDEEMRAQQFCQRCQQIGVSILAPHWQQLNSALFRWAEVSQILLLPWTVNDLDHGRSLLHSSRVLGVITDIPEKLIACVREFPEKSQLD
jgi:glycerophosphoryl diester phosphodiesterase